MFSNFNNKTIHWINFGKTSKKVIKVQLSTFRLKDRSNIQNLSIKI